MKNIKNTKKYWKYRSGKGGWENPSLPDPDPTPNSVQFQTLALSLYYCTVSIKIL